jgi:hypothetical protein
MRRGKKAIQKSELAVSRKVHVLVGDRLDHVVESRAALNEFGHALNDSSHYFVTIVGTTTSKLG